MNNRQRVFDILSRQPGSPLTPQQIATMSSLNGHPNAVPGTRALSLDAVTAALKWLVAHVPPLAQKHRNRRDFRYTIADGAVMPIDGRTREARNGTD